VRRGAEDAAVGGQDASARPALESRGVLGQIGNTIRAWASSMGQAVRGLLGAGGPRGDDVTQDFPITVAEARAGGRRQFRLHRDGEAEEILVTIPAGVKPGTKLRLRGKGAKGSTEPGDLYLRIQIS
jgi:curved DNA-binding protein